MRWVRFCHGQNDSYGINESDRIMPVAGTPFDDHERRQSRIVIGEVIWMRAASPTRAMIADDRVEIDIDGIGTLSNPIIREA